VSLLGLALVVLPGLLVVRAPWTAVAPLSLSFWALSAWWPPFAGPGRGRIVAATLAASFLLALLRLVPKHELEPPPGWRPPLAPPPPPPRAFVPSPALASAPSLLVLATALALLAPVPLWHHAPGPRLAFQTTTARLLVWRDGVPANAEPLLPLEPLGAHAPALATLAADVSHLSGLDPGPAALWLVAAAAGLLLVGLFSLHATWARPWPAALGALLGLAVSPWPGFLTLLGEGEALVALAFLLPAVALLVGHASRSSAVAGALLLAASALAQPVLTAAAALLSAGAALTRSRERRPAAQRLALSFIVALVLAAPGLWPLARALSLREVAAIALAPRTLELPPFALGLLFAALAPFAFVRAAERRSPRVRAVLAGVAVVAALLLVVRVHAWFAAGQLSDETRSALARAAASVPLTGSICAADGVRDFVPALAGRRVGEPGVWVPPVYSEEWARRERQPCAEHLESLPADP